jgi:hypothetical protein
LFGNARVKAKNFQLVHYRPGSQESAREKCGINAWNSKATWMMRGLFQWDINAPSQSIDLQSSRRVTQVRADFQRSVIEWMRTLTS